jgi:cob(I)alamin adenosyltransferase
MDEILNLWSVWPDSQPLINNILNHTPSELDLILTGRSCTQDLIDAVDLVTCMEMVKHPFALGILAKEGMDY